MLFVTGHSGAGKSTLLKLIHLAERPVAARCCSASATC
jgi:ABC-type ATPase involved in cell division